MRAVVGEMIHPLNSSVSNECFFYDNRQQSPWSGNLRRNCIRPCKMNILEPKVTEVWWRDDFSALQSGDSWVPAINLWGCIRLFEASKTHVCYPVIHISLPLHAQTLHFQRRKWESWHQAVPNLWQSCLVVRSTLKESLTASLHLKITSWKKKQKPIGNHHFSRAIFVLGSHSMNFGRWNVLLGAWSLFFMGKLAVTIGEWSLKRHFNLKDKMS